MIDFNSSNYLLSKQVCFSPASANGSSEKKTGSSPSKTANGNKRKGFASMSKERRLEIAQNGGNARKKAAESGNAPSYSEIGQKGGRAGTKSK